MLDGEKNWWVDPEFKILSALEKFEMWYFSGDAWRAKLTSTVLLISWITAQQLQDLCHRLQYLLDGCSWSHSDSQINPNWVIYNKGKSIHQEIFTLWFYQTLLQVPKLCKWWTPAPVPSLAVGFHRFGGVLFEETFFVQTEIARWWLCRV